MPQSLKIHHVDLDHEGEMWKGLVKLCDDTMNNPEMPHQKDWACHVKASLDANPDFNTVEGKGPWQVVVGGKFAAAITNESNFLCAFDIGSQSFLIYKNLGVMPETSQKVRRRSTYNFFFKIISM